MRSPRLASRARSCDMFSVDPRSSAERALLLFAAVTRPELDRTAAHSLATLLRAASGRTLRVVERLSRDRRAHVRLGIPYVRLLPADLSLLGAVEDPLGALAMATMVRSGYVREAAVRMLRDHVEPLSMGLLLNRLNDPVEQVVHVAVAGVQHQLTLLSPSSLVPYLPLLDSLDSWKRSRGSHASTLVDASLRSPVGIEALADATSHPDSEVRLSALRRLASHHGEGPELEGLLRKGLLERNPRIRAWAATTASEASDALLRTLLPVMAHNRTPFIRLAALRAMRRSPVDKRRLVSACFDPNANVRFYARRYVRALDVDHRARARELLEGSTASRGEQVGALAVLSDLGTSEDVEMVRRFASDPRSSVAREARRTLALLTA